MGHTPSDPEAPTSGTLQPISGYLEKSAKYTKSWAKRYMHFEPLTQKLEYGESESKIKSTMTVKKIVRASERSPKVTAASTDLYSFTVEGKLADGKDDVYAVRCPDAASFDDWFFTIRHAVGRSGSMDPFHYGLSDRDPRTNLPLVHVPVEHLFRFNLLDRAILYLFKEVNVRSSTGGDETTRELLIIGDRNLYLFHFSAEIHRCVPLTSIKRSYCGSGCLGLSLEEPQHDILIEDCLFVSEIAEVLTTVFEAIPNAKPIEVDTSVASRSAIQEKLHLTWHKGYELKVVAPTPKTKLKAAMDLYERQTGQPFVYGSGAKPAVALPKNAVHQQAPEAMDMDDPLAILLLKLGLRQYVVLLQRQHVDVDLIACMEAKDLVNFGVDNKLHCEMIAAAAKGEPIPSGSGSASPAPHSPAPASINGGASPQKARPAAIQLSDSDDDLPGPVSKPAQRMITLSSDDDDDGLILPKKIEINLDDDDDLPAPSPKLPAKAINLDDDDI
jgi:hypothetical protein